MPKKTVSQICKDYRSKKKQGADGETWKAKESTRVKRYYVPISEVKSEKELLVRRERNRQAQERRRARLKQQKEQQENESDGISCLPSTSTSTETLQVSFNFTTPDSARKKSRKRVSRALSKSHHQIKQLQQVQDKSKKKIWRLEKRLHRMQEKFKKLKTKATPKNKTPKDLAIHDLMVAGLDPTSHPCLLKKLTCHHALMAQIKADATKRKTKQKQSIERVVSGKIAKKYHILRYVGYHAGINRNRLGQRANFQKKRRLPTVRTDLEMAVISFLERDDVSRLMPGKRDATRVTKGSRLQTRILCDYMHNLWMKFTTENPKMKISLSVFCRMRPHYIKPSAFSSRVSCLCVYHQNLVLKLKAVGITASPDALIKEKTNEEIISAATMNETVPFYTWEKSEDRGHIKCIKKQAPQDQYVQDLNSDIEKFRGHVSRIAAQYEALKSLKESLQPGEVMVYMDFSENYTAKQIEEVQSAYWAQTQITIHPVIFYYREEDDPKIKHESSVYVSSVTAHNPTTVTALICEINSVLDEMCTPVTTVHYITDGPSSQYRNKIIFYLVANHTLLYLRSATWSYHEVGHGKGPCDGIGGTVKRLADDAVKQGKAVISSAMDFHEWLEKSRPTKITSRFLTEEKVDEAAHFLDGIDPKPVKNTLAIHAVKHVEPGVIAVRCTSCFCPGCKSTSPCAGWNLVHLKKHQENVLLTKDVWVAAAYKGIAYFGKVEAVRERGEEEQVKVSFMLPTEGAAEEVLRWPKPKDVLWMHREDILCNVPAPTLVRKGTFMFSPKVTKKASFLISHLKSPQ